jgi:hypothetical protein
VKFDGRAWLQAIIDGDMNRVLDMVLGEPPAAVPRQPADLSTRIVSQFEVEVRSGEEDYPAAIPLEVTDGESSLHLLTLPCWREQEVELPLTVALAYRESSAEPELGMWSFQVVATGGGIEVYPHETIITCNSGGRPAVYKVEPPLWAARTTLRSPLHIELRYVPGDLLNRR